MSFNAKAQRSEGAKKLKILAPLFLGVFAFIAEKA